MSNFKGFLIFELDNIKIRRFRMSESAFKQIKVQDFSCSQCSKRFNDLNIYQTHVRTKHTQAKQLSNEFKTENKSIPNPETRSETEKAKPQIKPKHKNKGSEQMQQDTEDKIYAFLGELGVRHVEPDSQQENINQDDDRMMGQANYLENNIVRTPFEMELDVVKEINSLELPNKPGLDELFTILKADALALNQKLSLESEKWEFRDPIQMQKDDDQEFSLINIPNVLNNYRKKGLELKYPQFSVFLLWLAKICKSASWKQFFLVTAEVNYKYDEFLKRTAPSVHSQVTWKLFFQEFNSESLAAVITNSPDSLHILSKDELSNYIDLYEKWVCYFDPF